MTAVQLSQSQGGGARVRYYTVAQAARELQVHRTTITRWIKSGRLRASRVGPKAVRIKEADLEQVVTPTNDSGKGVIDVEERQPTQYTVLTGLPSATLSEEEKQRALASLDRLRAFREQLRHEVGTLPSDEDLIREGREARSSRL